MTEIQCSMMKVVFAVLLATTVFGCQSDFDCSLNGKCAKNQCICDAPWKDSANGKEKCSVLDVLPFPNDYVPAYGGPRTSTAWQNQSVTSWGGNILRGLMLLPAMPADAVISDVAAAACFPPVASAANQI